SVVIMPVTVRELEDPQVLKKIAAVHRDLITRTNGNLHFKIVYNDHRSQDSATVASLLQRFERFFSDEYQSRTVPGVYGKNQIEVAKCVSYEVLNDSHVQESLINVHRSSGGANRAAPGKGNAIALGVYKAIREGYDNVILHDSDVLTFDKTPIIEALLVPLLEGSCEMTKLSFIRYANGVMNGRLTRGFSLPILNALNEHAQARDVCAESSTEPEEVQRNRELLRHLAGFRYPFSGEIGFKTEYLKGCPIHPTYGLESAFINDAAERLAIGTCGRIGDVMISQYDHFHSPMGKSGGAPTGLYAMLEQTYQGLLVPLIKRGVISRDDMGHIDNANSIIGRGLRIWRDSLASDLAAVETVISDTVKLTKYDRELAESVVRNALGISDGGFEESSALTESDKVAKLKTLIDSGVPTELVYGIRLLNQLRREQGRNAFFNQLEELVQSGKFLDSFVPLPKFAEEMTNWVFDPQKLGKNVTPLYRDPPPPPQG
ncbi:MAG: hypothetical protein EBZ48_05725, partial [Proteobacteria bacterium]|nr:hypothetical protein [Pseudomonadota bacterium]